MQFILSMSITVLENRAHGAIWRMNKTQTGNNDTERACSSLSQTEQSGLECGWWCLAGWPSASGLGNHQRSFASVDGVKRAIIDAWQKLPESFIDTKSSVNRRVHSAELNCKSLKSI